jgi:hypothetical protein
MSGTLSGNAPVDAMHTTFLFNLDPIPLTELGAWAPFFPVQICNLLKADNFAYSSISKTHHIYDRIE